MDPAVIIIFILVYLLTVLLSATKIIPMSVAALGGALLTAWFGLQYGVFGPPENAYGEMFGLIEDSIPLLCLIVGTMIVVEVAEKSGLFRFGALYAVKLSKGNPVKLFVAICVVSAAVSMFLSDPTALLLMAAAAVTISKLLDYDPIPYILSATIMINLGGTSTLIGSASNMIIGVASSISFSDFIVYLTLCEVALWGLTIFTLYKFFKPRLGKQKPLPEYNPWQSIENKKAFYQSIFILVLLLLLFLTLERLGIGPEAVALGCAIVALVFSNVDPEEIFKKLDWETVFFIAGFMFIVGGIERTGVLSVMSEQMFQLFGGSPLTATLATLWFSGAASAIVSNLAVALTFVPIAADFASRNPGLHLPVSSALVLGTNLGGATTPISGSVCVMAVGTLKREGISVNFAEFTKVGFITSMIQLGFSSLYLIWRFGLGV